MDNYKFTIGVEPTNDCEKARKDLFKAMDSINKLNVVERRRLAEEFFGVQAVAILENVYRQFSKNK